MDRDNTYQGSVCTDCVQLIANAETPADWSEDQVERWLEDIEEHNKNVEDVTLGHFHDSDRCSHEGEECADDCDCEDRGFSWMPCDYCGSRLGGDRHDAVFWLKAEEMAG